MPDKLAQVQTSNHKMKALQRCKGGGSTGDATEWKDLNNLTSQAGLQNVKDSGDMLYKEAVVSRFTVCLMVWQHNETKFEIEETQVITDKQMSEHHCPLASFTMATKQRRLKDFSETVVLSIPIISDKDYIGKRGKKSVTEMFKPNDK